jgi:hypothetical protein
MHKQKLARLRRRMIRDTEKFLNGHLPRRPDRNQPHLRTRPKGWMRWTKLLAHRLQGLHECGTGD